MNELIETFTVKELAKYLSVSELSIRRSVQQNKIPFFRLQNRILFKKTAIDNWIASQSNSCKPNI